VRSFSGLSTVIPNQIDSEDESYIVTEDIFTIDASIWRMISLDTIGIAGFSHDFGSLDGKRTSVTELFDTFGNNQQASALNQVLLLLASVYPIIIKIPTKRSNLVEKLAVAMAKISDELLTRSRQEKDVNMSERDEEKSIIGLLSTLSNKFIMVSWLTRRSVKSEGQDAELRMSGEEIMAQVWSYVSRSLFASSYPADEGLASCWLWDDIEWVDLLSVACIG
jgi:hypothetical protein